MKKIALFLFLAAGMAAASPQSNSQTTKPPAWIPVVHGIVKTAFSLKYQDYNIGTGPLTEPNELYHVLYTGYIAISHPPA